MSRASSIPPEFRTSLCSHELTSQPTRIRARGQQTRPGEVPCHRGHTLLLLLCSVNIQPWRTVASLLVTTMIGKQHQNKSPFLLGGFAVPYLPNGLNAFLSLSLFFLESFFFPSHLSSVSLPNALLASLGSGFLGEVGEGSLVCQPQKMTPGLTQSENPGSWVGSVQTPPTIW